MERSALLSPSRQDELKETVIYDTPQIILEGEEPPALYNSFTGFCIAINYIMGSGIFTLPFGFAKGGLVLTFALISMGWAMTAIAANYTLEFIARARTLEEIDSDRNRLIEKFEFPQSPNPLVYSLGTEKFNYTKCAEVFQGYYGKCLMQFYVSMYIFGCLWGFAAVFASSAARIVSEYVQDVECNPFASDVSTQCQNDFHITLAVFGVVVITMCLFDVGEQALVQTILTAYKFIATSLIFITLIMKILYQTTETSHRVTTVGAMHFSQMAVGFAPAISALNFSSNIPDIVFPLKNKGKAKTVTLSALAVCAMVYLALGFLGSIAFDDVNELVTLNWEKFSGCGTSGWDDCGDGSKRTGFGTMVQLIVYLYPPLSVLASYPLMCSTMGSNLSNSAPQFIKEKLSPRRQAQFFRLMAAILPLFLAFLFKNVNTISVICGLIGFFLSLIGPSTIQISSIYYSNKKSEELGYSPSWKTPYTSFYSGLGPTVVMVILSFACFLVAAITYIIST